MENNVTERLEDKVCIITGSGGAMSRAAAITFAAEGERVVDCDVDVTTAEETVRNVRRSGGTIESINPCDLSTASISQEPVASVIKRHIRIDVLYINEAALQLRLTKA